jgi:hypothetical protein
MLDSYGNNNALRALVLALLNLGCIATYINILISVSITVFYTLSLQIYQIFQNIY